MKIAAFITILSLTGSLALASDYSRPIFSDDFSAEGFGPRWGHYKSGSMVRDGILIGITPDGSDHSAVDSIRFDAERDLEVSVKFRFVSEKAKSFNVWFDDKDYKGSHAGHICNVNISPTGVSIGDAKTGNFRNDIYEKKKSNPPKTTAEDKAMLATKNKVMPASLTLQEWHTLLIQTEGEEISVSIDGRAIGSFKTEGVGHDHKTLVSLTTNQVDVHYDDFNVKGVKKP